MQPTSIPLLVLAPFLLASCVWISDQRHDERLDPDGDGHPWPDDCDDRDANVHAGAMDWVGDDTDNNCDGEVDVFLAAEGAVAHLTGSVPGAYAGSSLDMAGDINADGFDDIVIGAPELPAYDGWQQVGAMYVVYGPVTGELQLSSADHTIIGSANEDRFGTDVAILPDFNGDAFADVVVTASKESTHCENGGMAYLFTGPLAYGVDIEDAEATWWSELEDDRLVGAVDAGDVDGDGNRDLLLGAHQLSYTFGSVYLVLGPATQGFGLSQAEATIDGAEVDDRIGGGHRFDNAGDTDGDGLDDLVIGTPNRGNQAGGAYLLEAPYSGQFDIAARGVLLSGESSEDYAGSAVSGLGDLNGDGLSDIGVGAARADFVGDSSGSYYVVHGPVEQDASLQDVAVRLDGDTTGAGFGAQGIGTGDLTGDGRSELLACAPEAEHGKGVCYLFLGPLEGALGVQDADMIIVGQSSSDMLGGTNAFNASGGDVDGDGLPDILLAVPGSDAGGGEAGGAFLIAGGT